MVRLILYPVFIIIAVCLSIRYIERHSIFFPEKEIAGSPADYGLNFEEVFFERPGRVLLNAWFIPAGEKNDTVILCHGNAGNISHRIEKALILHRLGLNVFLFEYSGYGKSQGFPSEANFYKDSIAAYRYLTDVKKISPGKIILYGESIGGAVAIDLALKARVKALITEETFSSIADMAGISMPFLPAFLLSSRFDAAAKIGRVKAAKLIIHSPDDEIVPFEQGKKLFDAAPEPKSFLKIRGTHNSAFMESEDIFRRGLQDFLGSIK